MRFSLVLATVGRTDELRRFLLHLDRQTCRDFELILIDQNLDGFLSDVLAPFRNRFPVVHLHSERGLSRARNAGLEHVSGELIAFPDDDCWYPDDTLQAVSDWFASHAGAGLLTGQCVDEHNAGDLGRRHPREKALNRYTTFRHCVSFTIFVRAEAAKQIGQFNEELGLGAERFSSGEESEYALRALHAGLGIWYSAGLRVHHHSTISYDREGRLRGYNEARALSWILKRHGSSTWSAGYFGSRAAAATLLALARLNLPKARYHFAALKGLIHGWYGESRVGGLTADSVRKSEQ